MNKQFFIFMLLLAFFSNPTIYAQLDEKEKELRKQPKDTITGWKTGGMVSLNFSQTSLINWASGGENSYSGNGLVNLFANYKRKKLTWDNSLDIGYGLLKQGEEGLRKTDDKIDFLSKYGRNAFSNWYFAGLVHFKTQMTPGYNYPNDSVFISRLFAPAYTLISIGMDYKPSDNLNLFISPLTGKFTFVNDERLANEGAFGVTPAEYDGIGTLITAGKKSRAELGGYVRFLYKRDVFENVNFLTKVDLFTNYLDNPQRIDINWEVLIALKVNKFITATIATHLIYDHDINITDKDGRTGPRTQFKEVFAVGFSYKINQ
jgi:hypothetical protein